MGPISIISGIIAFFNSPFGKWLGVALIGVVIFFAGDIRGRRIEHAKCEAAAQRAVAAANQQDQKARQEVAVQAEETIKDLRTQKEQADGKLAQLELQLKALPIDAPCLYGADDRPSSGRVREDKRNGKGAGNPGTPRPAIVSPAR